MYSQLLASALDSDHLVSDELDGDQPVDGEPTAGAALSHLLRCRSQLGVSRESQQKGEGSYVTLANHLAYDAALIQLARLLGVQCSADEYDFPEKARSRLEAFLRGQGIPLDEIEPPTGFADGR